MMNDQTPSTGFRWTTLLRPRWSISLFVAALALLRLSVEFIPTRIEIGPETTVLDGPLRPDGTVDYVAVMDQHWSERVAPDDNAAVDFLKAFGPEFLGEQSHEHVLESLGLDEMPAGGQFAVDFFDYREVAALNHDTEEWSVAWRAYSDAYDGPWTAEESPIVARWLASNESLLQRIIAATRKPRYYLPVNVCPNNPYLYMWSWDDAQFLRDAARILCIASMHALGNDDINSALSYSLACHRLARLEAQMPRLLDAHCARAIDAIATTSDASIVLSGQLTPAQAADYRNALQQLPLFPSIAEVVDCHDRWLVLDLVQSAFIGNDRLVDNIVEEVPFPGSFDPNPVLREINRVVDMQVAGLRLWDRSLRNQALQDAEVRPGGSYRFDSRHLRLAKLIGSSVLIGRHFAERAPAKTISGADTLIRCVDGRAAWARLAETLFAIAEFRARHGDFPDSLAELVPDVLSELPIDPYSNSASPLLYRRRGEQFVLYSIGENGVDDGGRWYQGGDDIAVGATTDSPDDE